MCDVCVAAPPSRRKPVARVCPPGADGNRKSLEKHHKQKIHTYKQLKKVGFFTMPIEGVEKLVAFMKKFEEENTNV